MAPKPECLDVVELLDGKVFFCNRAKGHAGLHSRIIETEETWVRVEWDKPERKE